MEAAGRAGDAVSAANQDRSDPDRGPSTPAAKAPPPLRMTP